MCEFREPAAMNPTSPSRMPRLLVVHTGGTIETRGADRLDLVEYVDAGSPVEAGELWAALPELAAIAQVDHLTPSRRPSHAWTPDDWLALSNEMRAAIEGSPPTGIVVISGTNVLEELAFFLDLVFRPSLPVVVVGAMRPASSIGADGPLSLFRAAVVATDPASAGRGVLVVSNESVFLARDVAKTATYAIDAFAAPTGGPVASIDADHRVRYRCDAATPPYAVQEFDRRVASPLPRVEIVVSYAGADASLIDAAIATGAAGIVVAGTGAGYPTPDQLASLSRAVELGIAVCISTRAASGRVVMTPARRASGFLVSGTLGPWKARLLLMACLSAGVQPADLRQIFDEL